jgi:hypothetical protein
MGDIGIMGQLSLQQRRPTGTTNSSSDVVVRKTNSLLDKKTLHYILVFQGTETNVLVICQKKNNVRLDTGADSDKKVCRSGEDGFEKHCEWCSNSTRALICTGLPYWAKCLALYMAPSTQEPVEMSKDPLVGMLLGPRFLCCCVYGYSTLVSEDEHPWNSP